MEAAPNAVTTGLLNALLIRLLFEHGLTDGVTDHATNTHQNRCVQIFYHRNNSCTTRVHPFCVRAAVAAANIVQGVPNDWVGSKTGVSQAFGGRARETDAIPELAGKAGAAADIPSRSSRKPPQPLDREICRTRSLVERLFGKLREFRRVATRCSKTGRNSLSAVQLDVSRFLHPRIANPLIDCKA